MLVRLAAQVLRQGFHLASFLFLEVAPRDRERPRYAGERSRWRYSITTPASSREFLWLVSRAPAVPGIGSGPALTER
jgi:hypothetical protein